jgi:hypothetical protein
MAFAGGCLCGRVRYTVEGEPNFAAVCHCRSCQRYTGSAFEPVMVFPSQAVQVQGDLKTYDDVGDSGKFVHRRFCPNCGSGVIADVDVMPGVTIVLAGSLDEPAVFKSTQHSVWPEDGIPNRVTWPKKLRPSPLTSGTCSLNSA